MLSINIFNVMNLNRDANEDFIFKLKSKEIELSFKKD